MPHAAGLTPDQVAPSFVRVGHIELFGRRAKKQRTPEATKQLEQIVRHAIVREFPAVAAGLDPSAPLEPGHVLAMLRQASRQIAALTADWIRVGYVQSNFNSDNCLVAGRTMDYGPFGFVEKYSPLWNMWAGSGDHFGFMNQPTAGGVNLGSLVTATLPLLETKALRDEAQAIAKEHGELAEAAVSDVWRRKLGFQVWDDATQALRDSLELLMDDGERNSPVRATVGGALGKLDGWVKGACWKGG